MLVFIVRYVLYVYTFYLCLQVFLFSNGFESLYTLHDNDDTLYASVFCSLLDLHLCIHYKIFLPSFLQFDFHLPFS